MMALSFLNVFIKEDLVVVNSTYHVRENGENTKIGKHHNVHAEKGPKSQMMNVRLADSVY